jgi:cytochrome c oxidase subunit 2
VLAGIALAGAGCAPTSVTEQGRAIYATYNFFLYVAAVVFLVVSGLLVWSMIRYRRRGDELPRQIHGNNKLELTWTLIPLLLVIVLFVVTIQAQNKSLEKADRPALEVDVLAFQWSWRFAYEGQGVEVVGAPGRVPELVVPVGQPVRIRLRSADVVHSFYVPRTLFKRQAIPGRTTEFDLTFEKVGTYQGHCVQFCGLAHDDMLFRVRVVSPGEFQSWLAQASRSGSPSRPGT